MDLKLYAIIIKPISPLIFFLLSKSKKPLMEKRRRARINNCLVQLKSLVLQAMKKDVSTYILYCN